MIHVLLRESWEGTFPLDVEWTRKKKEKKTRGISGPHLANVLWLDPPGGDDVAAVPG